MLLPLGGSLPKPNWVIPVFTSKSQVWLCLYPLIPSPSNSWSLKKIFLKPTTSNTKNTNHRMLAICFVLCHCFFCHELLSPFLSWVYPCRLSCFCFKLNCQIPPPFFCFLAWDVALAVYIQAQSIRLPFSFLWLLSLFQIPYRRVWQQNVRLSELLYATFSATPLFLFHLRRLHRTYIILIARNWKVDGFHKDKKHQ
jgi:hypothetical protein